MKGRFTHLRDPIGLTHEKRLEIARAQKAKNAQEEMRIMREAHIQRTRDSAEATRREGFAMISEDHAAQALRAAQGLHVPMSTQISQAAPAVAASGPRNRVKKTITRENQATESTGTRNRKKAVSQKESERANPGRPIITQKEAKSSTRNRGRNKEPPKQTTEVTAAKAIAKDIADEQGVSTAEPTRRNKGRNRM
jgi:hypothetical protein